MRWKKGNVVESTDQFTPLFSLLEDLDFFTISLSDFLSQEILTKKV